MYQLPRCEVLPVPPYQAVFQIDGREVLRWNYGEDYPGPFFYPVIGPVSGRSVTRMGHPGAPDHDHHRSVWFAHNKVLGINFWGLGTGAVVRQRDWLVYDDGDQARMAVRLDWVDGHDPQPLLEQELIATLNPLENGEFTLSLQSTFSPRAEQLELQQTNFGFLAVRMAKSISARFGGGHLTSSTGLTGEPAIFGTAAEWMDYSGPMPTERTSSIGEPKREAVIEGITCFDHPSNPTFPSKWHVRDDGWMGASACRDAAVILTRDKPLVLRYLLHIHSGEVDTQRATTVAKAWYAEPLLRVIKSRQGHTHFELVGDAPAK